MVKTRFGKYKIILWLGGGSFGDVFLAEDTILNKQFALKVARMREEDVRMLEEEARLLASLQHPSIVRFYNVDIVEGRLVLAMEYVPGESLRKIINRKRCLELKQAVGIMFKIGDGIQYAHERSIIHRDLKPENIIISDLGEPKITDFGLARFIKPGSLSVSSAGTPVYMAPEAWSGHYSDRTDIWAMGAILFEMLSGHPPFLADNLDDLKRIINEGDVHSIRRLPDRVDRLIRRSLDPDPNNRPDVRSFCGELKSGSGIDVKTPVFIPEDLSGEIELTETQKEAIVHRGSILLLGAVGTGKTTTLTYAVKERIRRGIDPKRILVFTFTNRAAQDLRERLQHLVDRELKDLWIGTIHYICMRILRRDIYRIDYPEDFEVIGPDEQVKLLRSFGLGLNQAKGVLRQISLLKAKDLDAADLSPKGKWQEKVKGVYKRYQDQLKHSSLVDYDDLIKLTVKLLREHEDLRSYYQELFDFIFLDELQDITPIQYDLVKILARNNLFLTGDEDQSIYSWRGARREIIYQVMKEIKGLKTFLLSRSFRVPERIGQMVMALRTGTIGLLPVESQGQVTIYAAENEVDEANYVAVTIKKLVGSHYSFSDIAVLYRTNGQSRIFEEALVRDKIPYQIVGADRFYEREIVCALTSYLRAIKDKDADEAVKAIRKILKTKVPKAISTILINQIKDEPKLSPYAILEGLRSVSKLMSKALSHDEAVEFLEFARHFGPGQTDDLIEQVILLENLDLVDWGKNTVRLMTIHSSKGLEFKVVFLVGMNEGLLPSMRGTVDPESLEEERRLCYVAVTRASKRLFLSYLKNRYRKPIQPSRFLWEMFRR